MENNLNATVNLKQMWRDLSTEAKKNKKIKMEVFEKIFTETYALLSKYAEESSVDKSCIEMIAQAYVFANIEDGALNDSCLAACVLTERMLDYCAFNGNSTLEGATTVYIAEARKEVRLNFDDVGASISTLAKVYEDLWWQKHS